MVKWKSTFQNPHYPNETEFKSFFHNASEEKITYFINLWLSEGIPKIANMFPEEYQLLRESLASYLGIHSKSITLIGSARFGYSLAPHKKYQEFKPGYSDLDLSIINENVFEKFIQEFFKWSDDFTKKIVVARDKNEKHIWNENLISEPKKIKRGVFDVNRIPAFIKYPHAQGLLNKLSQEQIKWNNRNPSTAVKKITIRLYKSWDTFVVQNKLNLQSFLK